MALAIQDHTGKWSFAEYENFDTTSKTLHGVIHHFSSASNVYTLELAPEKKELRVNESTTLTIWKAPTLEVQGWVDEITDANGKPEKIQLQVQMTEPVMEKQFKSSQSFLWYVNGIENGNKENGYLEVHETTYKTEKVKLTNAIYTAPDKLPPVNAVTVRVDIYVPSGEKKVYNRTRSLRCSIDIYDAYEIKITTVLDNMRDRGATERMVDTASCKVRLSTKAKMTTWKVKDIYNTLLIMEKHKCQDGCTCEYMNKDYCTGMLNIKGVQTALISDEGKKAAVIFIPATAITPLFKITCPRNTRYVPSMTLMAGPTRIDFELKDGDQEFDYDESTSVIGKMKIIVRRMDRW